MHALIIEQDAMTALMIEDSLRDAGFTSFDFANSAADALEAAGRRCPDLITADVRLGAGTGLDAVQAICSLKPIPVVFVTAAAWEVRARIAGAVIVRKPFGTADLKRAVASATASG